MQQLLLFYEAKQDRNTAFMSLMLSNHFDYLLDNLGFYL
jgi:hypothetical protein